MVLFCRIMFLFVSSRLEDLFKLVVCIFFFLIYVGNLKIVYIESVESCN